MHEASFEKMRAIRAVYAMPASAPLRVLDVGSGCIEGSLSYRRLFPPPAYEYVGLDMNAGHNVDFVPDDIFRWESATTESFDLVISGQMLEHNPFFWITMAEIARVAKQGGIVAIIAPSTGFPHRFPIDCWRFYPDSWLALCSYVGLELVEKYRERSSWRMSIPGTYWRDAMMVARKPVFDNDFSRRTFYERLDTIVSTRTQLSDAPNGRGPAAALYERAHKMNVARVAWRPSHLWHLASQEAGKLRERPRVRAVRRRIWEIDGRRALERGERTMSPTARDRDTTG
jgi:SAM-dependent methyltransferase